MPDETSYNDGLILGRQYKYHCTTIIAVNPRYNRRSTLLVCLGERIGTLQISDSGFTPCHHFFSHVINLAVRFIVQDCVAVCEKYSNESTHNISGARKVGV